MIPNNKFPPHFLPIVEQFYTIQGEGRNTGTPAYFIRVAGCDVGCVWCDVKESWTSDLSQLTAIDDIVSNAHDCGAKLIVITGGEPCMYDLNELILKLKEKNVNVALETSGCYPLKGNVDWYCFSPKKFKEPIEEAYDLANELKIVVSHPSDLEWAEGHAKKVAAKCELYLQPEWSKRERFLPLIIDYVKSNPHWKISLQTHKTMNIP